MTSNTNGPDAQFAAPLESAAYAISAFTAVVNTAAKNIHQAVQAVSGGPAASQPAASRAGGSPGVVGGIVGAGRALLGGAGIGGAARAGLSAASAALGGPAGLALAGVALAATGAAKAIGRMTEGAKAFHAHLAQASASMAFAEAQKNLTIHLREREVGDRLAGSARALNEAEQRKFEARKEIDILTQRVQNWVSTQWENFKTGFLRQINNVAGAVNKIAENTDPTKPLTADEWAQQLADEDRKWREDWHKKHDWKPSPHDRGVPGGSWGGGGDFS